MDTTKTCGTALLPIICSDLIRRLFGEEEYITETGTMNIFIAWILGNGQKELVTPPLDDTILAGLTRDSILVLARERLSSQGWKISKRRIKISELRNAADEGRLLEVFGTGTSGTIAPVRAISYDGKDIQLCFQPGKEIGPVAECLKGWIEEIQYGDVPEHPWSVVI